PVESIITVTASFTPVVTPRTPATKNVVCVGFVPILIVLLSPESPRLPMWILSLLEPATLLAAFIPIAMLPLPVVFTAKAETPMAVFWLPLLLPIRAASPVAVLLLPVVSLPNALAPTAVLSTAVVLGSAPGPNPVLAEMEEVRSTVTPP